jgi:hypothetical protein
LKTIFYYDPKILIDTGFKAQKILGDSIAFIEIDFKAKKLLTMYVDSKKYSE